MIHRRANGLFSFVRASMMAWILTTAATAQDREPPRFEPMVGSLQKPGYLPFDEKLLARLRVPPGFRMNVFAETRGNARMMAVNVDGTVYLTRQMEGDVLLLRDTDRDGRAEQMRVVATGLPLVHGVAIHNTTLYLIAPTTVWTAEIGADGSLATPNVLINDLPDGGQHRARTIAVGPDDRLYMGVGSTCNACDETNPENATLLRANLDGNDRQIFARGLRHTIGFDWHPATGQLWGMDMGTDWRGDTIPPEELNPIVENGNYGWPFCFGQKHVDAWLTAVPPGGQSRAAYCAATLPPALTYTAHSAPIGLAFYRGVQFPEEYRGDAFVTLRGSWNRTPPSGYKVVRIRFENGVPARVDDFVTGFRLSIGDSRRGRSRARESHQFARLAGIAVAADGSLLMADDSNGVIYRVAWAPQVSRR
jgi:glucose/arabinose dehydrogenase